MAGFTSQTEGKRLKEQKNARQLLRSITTIAGFMETRQFVQTLLGHHRNG